MPLPSTPTSTRLLTLSPRTITHTRRISSTHASIERLKNPNRGGQNLTLRYQRLERTLREKQALERGLDQYSEPIPIEEDPSVPQNSIKRAKDEGLFFHGFRVPIEPKPPAADDCCMSGCAVCVYDLHEESVEAYKESLASLRASLTSQHIPEESWPESIQTPFMKRKRPQGKGPTSSPATVIQQTRTATLSAFEEMERALKERKARQVADNPPSFATSSIRRAKLSRRDIVAENLGMVYEGV